MNWLQYWPFFEVALIIGVFAVIIFRLWRSVKRRAQAGTISRPTTLIGWMLYVLKLLGVGVGAFLAVALVVIIERNFYSLITETAPAPSQVEIPADLPFGVEEVTFLSEDSLQMAGWYVPPQNGVTVILLHGYGVNRLAMRWHAERLFAAGYGLLMYDERASGESEGAYRSYGWEDPRDVGGAIEFLSARADPVLPKIGIAGCSIGGQIALQGAAYYPEIGAVWADGPSTIRARDISKPTNPIMALMIGANYMLDWMYEVKLGIDAPAPMIEIIDDIAPRPIAIVGGGTSMPFTGSESDHLKTFVRYAGENAELWTIPEAIHCDGPGLRPDEYATRMVGFFDSAFGIERR